MSAEENLNVRRLVIVCLLPGDEKDRYTVPDVAFQESVDTFRGTSVLDSKASLMRVALKRFLFG